MKKFKKANTVELGSKPPHGRIVWIAVSEVDGVRKVYCGSTHEGLCKCIERNTFDEFTVVDLKVNKTVQFEPSKENMEKFIKSWQNNYLNPKWGYKSINKIIN